jgi:hypothetical protein
MEPIEPIKPIEPIEPMEPALSRMRSLSRQVLAGAGVGG